jgi:hypothetical protein
MASSVSLFCVSTFSQRLICCLEEMLIDFREMVGKHSGENMAEEVWNCIEMYGLKEKVDRDDDTYDVPELVPI